MANTLLSMETLQAAAIGVLKYTKAHPIKAVMLVLKGLIITTPSTVTLPLLGAIGYTATGPAAGSAAAVIQSVFNPLGAAGFPAILQSAAMGGYGTAVVNGAAQGVVIVVFGTDYLTGSKQKVENEPKKESAAEKLRRAFW